LYLDLDGTAAEPTAMDTVVGILSIACMDKLHKGIAEA
jgi:hypothetical protein